MENLKKEHKVVITLEDGCLEGGGLEGANEVQKRKDLLEQVYAIGKSI